jgi:hypothetical protein
LQSLHFGGQVAELPTLGTTMTRVSSIILLLVLLGCARHSSIDLSAIRQEFGTILSPKFDAAQISSQYLADLNLVLTLLKDRRTRDLHDFDFITSIHFDSSTRVRALFSWSGGRHSGLHILEKRDGNWRFVDLQYYL